MTPNQALRGLVAKNAAERRARKITRLTGVKVGIEAIETGVVVWADGERVGPVRPADLDGVLDGVEMSAWTLADAVSTEDAA
ncbi:hypothetical protein [Gordonia sp. (in: high G+C Gram-positive bacteria)]|uniref:hypothetical protein n=1 Tax=Gordonia sp. (in: high G+C Gram-positive bacteria) TaxID=84139 RepID=UPI0033405B9A